MKHIKQDEGLVYQNIFGIKTTKRFGCLLELFVYYILTQMLMLALMQQTSGKLVTKS